VLKPINATNAAEAIEYAALAAKLVDDRITVTEAFATSVIALASCLEVDRTSFDFTSLFADFKASIDLNSLIASSKARMTRSDSATFNLAA